MICKGAGLQISTVQFPKTYHGMVEFVELPYGKRQYTRFTRSCFRLIEYNMKSIFPAPYGNAEIVSPSLGDR